MSFSAVLVAGLLLFGAAPPGPSPAVGWLSADALAGDVALLKEAGVATDSASLLAYVRKRTLTPAVRARAEKLIAALADDEFRTREQASADLLEMGPGIVGLLRPFTTSRDLEQRRRVQRLLRRLEPGFDAGHVAAAARLLAARRTAGGTAALLAYLPDAPSDSEVEQLREALAVLACPGGKPNREIVAALADSQPRRRAAAAFAVGQSGSKADASAVGKLLGDSNADVRAAAALGLALAGDRKSVAVLVALAGELPTEKRGAVEEALVCLAGEDAPATPGDDSAEGQKKRREMWLAWWNRAGDKVNLGRLHREALLGYTLCILFEGSVRVTELGRDNKPLWTISGLSNAVDAHIIAGNRVLIAEYGANRITERTFDGKVVWVQNFNTGRSINDNPFLVQRLANGNTFVTARSGVIEIDRQGKEVSARKDLGSLRAAWKYRDGRLAVVTSEGEYRRFDPSGKEETRYRTGLQISNTLGGIDFLADGGLLAVTSSTVMQYDRTGRKVWEAKGLQSPYCPTRLRNGNTLVACTGTQRFVEFDRGGKIVRTIGVTGVTPWRARRR